MDRLSYFRIVKKVMSLGYVQQPKIYWLPKGKTFANGLQYMYDDSPIHTMSIIAKERSNYIFKLYLDHLINVPIEVGLVEGNKGEGGLNKKNALLLIT